MKIEKKSKILNELLREIENFKVLPEGNYMENVIKFIQQIEDNKSFENSRKF